MSTVFNLRTCGEYEYSLNPREAVIAAYAQFEKKDWNTADYEKNYGHLVQKIERDNRFGKRTIYVIGDFTATERK